jgi:hypothetical protein
MIIAFGATEGARRRDILHRTVPPSESLILLAAG